MNQDYYLGLHMTDTAVGWAVTNERYELMRAKGKDLWGVRTFDMAETAQKRRSNRCARRLRQREVARLNVLRSYFADELNKIDAGFLLRCKESALHKEDRSESNQQPFSLFCDENFTDTDYFKKYPTIYHLRKELLESDVKPDIRLVYLAIQNMFKHRGNFWTANLDDVNKMGDLKTLAAELCKITSDMGIKFPSTLDIDAIENILVKGNLSRSKKQKAIMKLLAMEAPYKEANEIMNLICGLNAKCNVLFEELAGMEKAVLCFSASTYEEDFATISAEMNEDSISLVECCKEIYDACLLNRLRRGYMYLSQARVAMYDKHKEDLKLLRQLIRQYLPEEYNDFFRKMDGDNYSFYVGSVNSKIEKKRRGRDKKDSAKSISENFFKRLTAMLKRMPQDDERVQHVLADIEGDSFLEKQLTDANGVIPNQLHLAELHAILENVAKHYPFLLEKDDSGLTVQERIEQLFAFHVPYYVGPLNDHYKNRGGNAWVVRKEPGTVYPWNIEEKVDMKASRVEFIERMVRKCTYLKDEKVLPKNSLAYETFAVLNELNGVKIRGKKISVMTKQSIYNNLLSSGKKITLTQLFNFLVSEGVLEKDEKESISGIGNGFTTCLSTYSKFYATLGERFLEKDVQNAVEDIVFWATIYGNDKSIVKGCIEEKYPDMFSEAELKRILGFKFRDWGNLSGEFLNMEGAYKKTGELMSIKEALWNTNDTLMELLSDKYTFAEVLESTVEEAVKTLSEFTYEDLDGLYLTPPTKRMTWQAFLIVKDLMSVLKVPPTRIFMMSQNEEPYNPAKEKEKEEARKKDIIDLYKKCKKKDDERDWVKEITEIKASDLRSKRRYLYYMQKGRCMYTGEPIKLEDVFDETLYDIDHIYPRHYIKDDNIDNNLVLVKRSAHAPKKDEFPLDKEIQDKQYAMWKQMRKEGFLSEEKYMRLTRTFSFTDEELADFITKQMGFAKQGAKTLAKMLKMAFPNVEIVYSARQNSADFRQTFDLYKVDNVNDFYTAHDAYLNVVVGNAYYTKFTKSPIHFIKEELRKSPEQNAYHMGKMFDRNIVRDGKVAWQIASKDGDEPGTIAVVRKTIDKTTPIVTHASREGHGELSNATIYPAKVAKEWVYIPAKTSDPHLCDVTKYGGKTCVSSAYYMVVEHGTEGKRKNTIEMVPIYLKKYVEASEANLIAYCENVLKLVDPVVKLRKIPTQSLIKWNGFYLYLNGRTGKRFTVFNATPMYLSQEYSNYIKLLTNYVRKGTSTLSTMTVSAEKNIELYKVLMDKHKNGIYAKKPNPMGKLLESGFGAFQNATLIKQAEALLAILRMTVSKNNMLNLPDLDMRIAQMTINNDIGSTKEFLLIYQSPTGLYEKVIDLKKL